ncbi:carbohydrate esterase family 3 protein [Xylaria longipes]|nr:carbohydrate esterase family 3 protein [Xylaria longipes]
MGTSRGGDWRSFMSMIQGRKSTILFALLLVTISLITYSFHGTIEVETLSFHDGTNIDNPNDSVVQSQHPQDPASPVPPDKLPPSNPHADGDALNPSSNKPPVDESSVESGVAASIQSVSTSDALLMPLSGGVPLRVMFLGASVTRGAVSVGNLGYRSPLRDRLAALGNPVNFVGSQRVGAFKDNDLEAYPGNRIDQVHDHASHIVPKTKPNVFVLHVGSNDCLQKHDTGNAGTRMRTLIDYLFKASPRATVIMSSLLTNTVPDKEPCILDLNIQIRKLASALQREGRPVVFAEMHYEQGLPDRPVPADISSDGTHPFDHGYRLMADIFFSAFLEADRRGFLRTPEGNKVPGDGELERADEPLVFEMEPAKKWPGHHTAEDMPQVEKTADNSVVSLNPAPEMIQKVT